jgi:hypothetical protein
MTNRPFVVLAYFSRPADAAVSFLPVAKSHASRAAFPEWAKDEFGTTLIAGSW